MRGQVPDPFGTAFLDVISCGLGAVLILMMVFASLSGEGDVQAVEQDGSPTRVLRAAIHHPHRFARLSFNLYPLFEQHQGISLTNSAPIDLRQGRHKSTRIELEKSKKVAYAQVEMLEADLDLAHHPKQEFRLTFANPPPHATKSGDLFVELLNSFVAEDDEVILWSAAYDLLDKGVADRDALTQFLDVYEKTKPKHAQKIAELRADPDLVNQPIFLANTTLVVDGSVIRKRMWFCQSLVYEVERGDDLFLKLLE